MCNLYRMRKGVGEIARLFDAGFEHGANVSGELYPGYPGLVVAEGQVRAMTWGFPLSLKGSSGQRLKSKPVPMRASTSCTRRSRATVSYTGVA